MNIIAHRGLWRSPEEKNSEEAFRAAFDAGFGAEIDVRDLDGELVVSHDMPVRGALEFDSVLQAHRQAGQPGWLAINIKSDGLSQRVAQSLVSNNVSRYFCFDMSVPDTLPYLRSKMIFAARLSEYEPEGRLSECAPVLWVDGFDNILFSSGKLMHWLNIGKHICIVAPELHGRDEREFWRWLTGQPRALLRHPRFMVCTDFPENVRRLCDE